MDPVGRQPTLGKTPRNFVIDPTGKFLLVANQNSNEIIIFRRDHKTGLLTPADKSIQVSQPVCLKFCYWTMQENYTILIIKVEIVLKQ